MRSLRKHQPTFFWQGVLILFPVVILAGAGLLSLRQDRALARHEAMEKAQSLAEELANVLWAGLTARTNLEQIKDHAFQLDLRGRLLFPPPAGPLPTPQPFDLASFDQTQRTLWLAANTAQTDPASRSKAIAAVRQLAGLDLPAALAAAAQFRLGVLLEADAKASEAVTAYRQVVEKFPEATSESGLPLAPLAQLKILQLAARVPAVSKQPVGLSLDVFCSNLVFHPTFLTPHLLAKAGEVESSLNWSNVVESWESEWERHESLRGLAAAARAQAPVPRGTASDSVLLSSATGEGHVVPGLFWFHALDLSPNPQPLFRQGLMLRRAERSSHTPVFSATISGLALPQPAPPPPRRTQPRTEGGEVAWLASRLDDTPESSWIICRALGQFLPNNTTNLANIAVSSPAWGDLRESLPTLPPWFDFSLDLAGVTLVSSNNLSTVSYRPAGKGSGQTWQKVAASPTEVLATARRFDRGIDLLRLNIHLVSPEMLFARQQARTRLFGLLIAASTVVAVIGFVSARRSFLRQQQLSELKSNFVSSVSHELRAPIASVRLLAENLERGAVQDRAKQREYFHFIGQECRRLAALIENVLNFARIEQGRQQYEFEPTDVVALVQQTAALMEPAAVERQIRLQPVLPKSGLADWPAPPLLDGQAIQQALINLIDNALKHSPPGSTVIVGLECVPPASSEAAGRAESAAASSARVTVVEGGLLRLYVQDQGPGIPRADHERIFERFYRRGSELRRETQGVGIGLSIVKHIVEAHQGWVTVQSEVGQGSCFTIHLPQEGGRV